MAASGSGHQLKPGAGFQQAAPRECTCGFGHLWPRTRVARRARAAAATADSLS